MIEAATRAAARSPFIRNIWYVGLWAEELAPGKMISRTILGEPVVFFRKQDGSPAAISDTCSHRFAPLSLGHILPGDRIQCPYHGLEFDTSGHCVKNPHGNGAIPQAAHIRAYPVAEKHTLVWIWMGDKPADPALIPDYSCMDNVPALHATAPGYLHMTANYELVVDNLLDLSHTSYLHAGILGNADTVVADISVTQVGDSVTVSRPSKDAETPGILKMMAPDIPRGDQVSSISWFPASNLLLKFGVVPTGQAEETGTGYYAIHLLTPETERTTHYCFTAVRWHVLTESDELNAQIRDKIAAMRKFAFSEQDAPVIEAQQKRMDLAPVPLVPTLLAIDAGPVQYRRILERMLHEEAQVANAAE